MLKKVETKGQIEKRNEKLRYNAILNKKQKKIEERAN